MKAWAFKATTEVVKAFKVREEYRQEVLISYRDTFLQGFKLRKAWTVELFPDMDVKKLEVELPSGCNEGSDNEMEFFC